MLRILHSKYFLIALLLVFCLLFSEYRIVYASHSLYHSKYEMIQMYRSLCDAHKDVASYEIIGKSVQGGSIWLFKVGNPNGGRVMIDGEIHGPEDAGAEFGYLFLKWVLESGDQRAKNILRRNYLMIIPIINVDTTARQNMRRQYILSNGTIIRVKYGVDLNRNAVSGWGKSGSGNPNNNYNYRGLYAGSEPEIKAVRYAMQEYHPDVYCNCHFGGEYLWYKNDSRTGSLTSKILSLYYQYARERNVTRYRASYGLSGGMVAADAYSFGASAWLAEFGAWNHIPEDYNLLVRDWYPRAFPLFLAFCDACAIARARESEFAPMTVRANTYGLKLDILTRMCAINWRDILIYADSV